jgi:hypothetical protein
MLSRGNCTEPHPFHAGDETKIDSVAGKAIYNQRGGTVEPVFGNLG